MIKKIYNFIKSQYIYRFNKDITLTLFITNRCNLKCIHCFYSKYLNTKSELSFDEIVNYIKKNKRINRIQITGGEPFLVKDMDKLISKLIKNKIKDIVIATNGTLHNRIFEFADKVKNLECNITFSISLDGLERMHDNIRGFKGSFTKALFTANKLKQEGFEVYFNTVIHKSNINEIKSLSDYIDKNSRVLQTFEIIRGVSQTGLPKKIKNDTDPKETNLLIEKKDVKIFKNKILKIFKNKLKFKKYSIITLAAQLADINYKLETIKKEKRIAPCIAGSKALVLYPEGDLAYCELMNPVGNIRKQTQKEIHNSKYSKIQKIIISKCYCTHGCFVRYESKLSYPFRILKTILELLL